MYKLSTEEQAILDNANQILVKVMESTPSYAAKEVISDDNVAVKHFKCKIACEEREHFMVLFLDNQHYLLSSEILFSGTINEASVYPREIVKRALALNASAIIIGHNHPSGILEASYSDRLMTEKIDTACRLIDVRLLDHIIVSPLGHLSFAEKEYL